MEKKPVKVRLVGRTGDKYNIQFPNLQIPVTVNETLYYRMLRSKEYQFVAGDSTTLKKGFSQQERLDKKLFETIYEMA